MQEIVWEDINKGGHDPYFSFGTLMGPFQPASQLTRLSLRNVTLQHKLYFLTSFLADVISLTGLRCAFEIQQQNLFYEILDFSCCLLFLCLFDLPREPLQEIGKQGD